MQVDIFCHVIDNWGDAGVCWRLASQLAREHGASTRLWIDRPELLRTWQSQDTELERAIDVCAWDDTVDWSRVVPAACVIEAFGCELPAAFVARMVASEPQPKWVNLEYLSAESWVQSHHLLPSPQAGGLNKVFYFPGFNARTGGLLREEDLLSGMSNWLAQHPSGWSEVTGFETDSAALKISLFGYEQMPLQAWLPLLVEGERSVQLAVCHGKASEQLRAVWDELVYAKMGEVQWQQGALTVRFLPMVSQQVFDQLLWCADVNCVRGEDSLVRAIWAGKPLVWDIYKQDDGVHADKLGAFAQVYCGANEAAYESTNETTNDSAAAVAWRDWNLFWNGLAPESGLQRAPELWSSFLVHFADIAALSKEFQSTQAALPDVCDGLLRLCEGGTK